MGGNKGPSTFSLKTSGMPSPSGRGEPYLLKRPNVFVGSASEGVLEAGDRLLAINGRLTDGITHVEAQNIFRNSGTLAELEVARTDPEMIGLPRSNHVPQLPIQDTQLSTLNDEVPIDDQPYRNSCVALPAPRTINDLPPGRGAPVYQQYRGPQFNTQMAKPALKTGLPTPAYNSPVPLYSKDNLAEALAENPGFVQAPKPSLPTVNTATISKPHESETFRMILESEMGGAKNHAGIGSKQFERQLSGQDRPGSQQSDRSSDAGRPSLDPVMKNNTINQSASFKKVMYSVMGETEF